MPDILFQSPFSEILIETVAVGNQKESDKFYFQSPFSEILIETGYSAI